MADTIEEQNKILASGRSNNYLDTSKLMTMYPDLNIMIIVIISGLECRK